MNPQTLAEEMRFNGKGWREWYGDDDHYHDFAMLGAYGFKGGAVLLGMYGLTSIGLL